MRSFIALLLLNALFIPNACTQKNATVLSGHLKMDANWRPTLYLVRPDYYRQLLSSYEGSVVDSVKIEADGSFALAQPAWLQSPTLCVLFAQPKERKYKNEISASPNAHNFIVLVLEPGKAIQLSGKIASLSQSYQLEQSNPESAVLRQIQSARAPFYEEFAQNQSEIDTSHSWSSHGSPTTQLLVDAALDAIMDTCQMPFPIYTALRIRVSDNEFRERPEFFLSTLEKLRKMDPDNPWNEQLAQFMSPENMPVLKGEHMPNFRLSTPQGDTLQLGAALGKLTLVDFWASWCAPCRKEMRETIGPLYGAYHSLGFNVLGVSIDSDRQSWERAIEKDKAQWYNVSDLMGDESPVRESLKFRYIPANYLLDAEGRLLERNLHGEALRLFVAEYLKK